MIKKELEKKISHTNYSDFIKSRFMEALKCKVLYPKVNELLDRQLTEKEMFKEIDSIAIFRVETVMKNGRIKVKYWPVYNK